jgi:hypothetical protein
VETCATCGHTLPPVGRYCTNCGTRRAPAGGTPVGGSAPPPPLDVAPGEADSGAGGPAPDPDLTPPDDPGWLLDPAPDDLPEERPPVSLPILGILVALALIAVIGAVLLLASRSGGEGRATDPGSEASVAEVAADADSGDAPPSPEPDASATTASDRPDRPRGKPREIRTRASVEVPSVAPESTTVSGAKVTYQGTNMLDGNRGTTWRMRGDGSGETITFTFSDPVLLTRVGLVNGYGKRLPGGPDWYAGNRRIQAARWQLDDGTTVRQTFSSTTGMQGTRVRRVQTRSVRLVLTRVSPPGSGPWSRDYTAISDVTLVGIPG